MTNEEKAKEWVRTNSGYSTKEFHGQKAIEAFLAGLKAGKDMAETDLAIVAYMQGGERYKLKWHKVADGDLPNNYRYVWTNEGAGYYDSDGWWDDSSRLQNVIAWCEPEYEE